MAINTYGKVFLRSTNHIGELADYLYKEVLLYCESDEVDNLIGVSDVNSNFISSLQNKIELDKSSEVAVSTKQKRPKNLNDTIKINGLDNKIHLISSINNLAVDTLRHIRNAYAHNLVVIDENDDGYVIIGDFLTNRHSIDFTKPTMLGRLSIDNLKFLVEQAKSLSK